MKNTSRRNALKAIGTVAATGTFSASAMAKEAMSPKVKLKNNIKHSACRWCYGSIDFEELVIGAKEIGLQSIELTGPKEWPILKKHGMTSAIGWGDWPEVTLPNGSKRGSNLSWFFADPATHDTLVAFYEDLIPQAAEAGITQLICFSGNRNGMNDYVGMQNCAQVIRRLIPTCEKHNVILSMELLSSRDSHRDYMCDHIDWGVSLCEMVNSDYFKLLYDIFHMQSMHGDHIRNIRRYGKYISHYHTGGMPGRKEIDETQEIYYPAVIQALIDSGYKGFLGQEFIPSARDKEGMLASLERCVRICDV
ncbi:hydroxypyruvate isomerase family protein [Jiulongibacter sediminis]|jgi:hydroxypyruvate isomerase|uniref:hydroxypyruvate isomerase family protein n=1 Tax=Jiulongibacter sediminis TaxID=1605367 RepID=UPI0026EEB90A|nr:sugar phosphate isomerase/epimerase family protein [Jiulongibacter sediminis]